MEKIKDQKGTGQEALVPSRAPKVLAAHGALNHPRDHPVNSVAVAWFSDATKDQRRRAGDFRPDPITDAVSNVKCKAAADVCRPSTLEDRSER